EGASVAVATNELLAELQRWMDEELDFGLELRNLEKLHQALEGERRVRIPRPYPALSGPRVVTSSYLRGVRFSDLLRWIRAGEGGRIEEQGLDREALARNLVDAVLDQIFQLDRFHADPHPGNLMALPGDAIGFVDFGRMDHLTEDLRRVVSRNLQAIYNADAERMHAALTDLLIPGQRVDSDAFRADFIGRSRAYSRERTEDRPPPGTRSPLASYLRDVMRLARRHGYRLPPDVLSLYRALLSVESVCQELGTQANLRTVGRRFFARYQVAQAVMDLTPDRLWQSALDGLALLREGPGHLQRVLSDLAQDRFLLRVRTTESTDDRREANRRARLVTAGLISVGLAVLLAAVDRIPLLGRWPPAATVLASLLGACYVWIFVLWKRLS
ncbi:MAG TPA: AarF/UbiB family protein, partial [Myxococcales bacterium]|nr:AarF/UbiB family protein [Myxococcales bacterium]